MRYMRAFFLRCSWTASLFLVTLLFLAPVHAAQIPKFINFQGQLTDSSGAKVNGSRTVTFAIYSVATGGSPLYSEAQSVVLSNGVGSALIGTSTPLNLPFDTQYYLGVTIAGDGEMTPRIQLAASAYAFAAQELADSAKAQGTLTVTDTLVVGDTRLVVMKSGNVGIDTSIPTHELDVNGIGRINGINIGGYGTTGSNNSISTEGVNIRFLTDAGAALPTFHGSLYVAGSYAGSAPTNGAYIQGKVGIGATSPSGYLQVATSSIGDTIWFVDTGIGIGTSNPSVTNGVFKRLLHIKSADNPGIVLENTSGSGKHYLHTHSNGSFAIMNDITGAEPFYISGNDSIGIGTTSPTAKLTVSGTVNATAFSGDGSGLTGIAGDGTGGWTLSNGTSYKTSGAIGLGTASPADSFHIEGGHMMMQRNGEQQISMKRLDLTDSPTFKMGRIIIAGDGSPEIRFIYSDNSIPERSVFEFDNKGIVASVKPAAGSHFEGFISGEVNPLFRLNSVWNGAPTMQLEMGGGGSNPTDVILKRSLARDLIIYTGDSANEQMRIDSQGRVGINTTSPTDSLTVVGDISATGGFKSVAGQWFVTNAGAGVTAETMYASDATNNNDVIVLPYAGSVMALSLASNFPRTAGTFTAEIYVNNTATGLTAALDGTNTQFVSTTQAKDVDVFAAGARIGVKYTTDGPWSPTTADVVATVVVEF